MRLLVVTSIPPVDSSSGPLVLYRHLTSLRGISVRVATDLSAPGFAVLALTRSRFRSALLARLPKGPLYSLVSRLTYFLDYQHQKKQVRAEIRHNRPDLILSVAHGVGCLIAAQAARSTGLPLVLFFHDWWPDISGYPKIIRLLLDKIFLRLARQSFGLCVSPAMCEELGGGKNLRLLYPIPQAGAIPTFTPSRRVPLIWVHAGGYLQEIASLAEATASFTSYALTSYGPQPPSEGMNRPGFAQRYGGFLAREELEQRLREAVGFIVPMPFFSSYARQVRTSFPSKLVEYARYGKPILVWGPEGCSAVQWARETGAAECVTSPDPLQVAARLETLSQDKPRMEQLGRAAAAAYRESFQPEILQKLFEDTLLEAAASTGK